VHNAFGIAGVDRRVEIMPNPVVGVVGGGVGAGPGEPVRTRDSTGIGEREVGDGHASILPPVAAKAGTTVTWIGYGMTTIFPCRWPYWLASSAAAVCAKG
jgi:hypothetical protein